jgi:hypothetical protein
MLLKEKFLDFKEIPAYYVFYSRMGIYKENEDLDPSIAPSGDLGDGVFARGIRRGRRHISNLQKSMDLGYESKKDSGMIPASGLESVEPSAEETPSVEEVSSENPADDVTPTE